MANNRLYLRCRQCGAKIFLAKHFMSPWYIDPERLRYINEFLAQHCSCPDRKYDVHYNSFELVDEFREGFPEEDDKVLYHYYDIYNNNYDIERKQSDFEYKCEQIHSAYIEDQYNKE